MSRSIVIQLSSDIPIPPILEVNGKGAAIFKTVIESLLAQGLVRQPAAIQDPLNIDSPDMSTVNVVYKDLGQNLAPGSLVVVNPHIAPAFDALLEVATVIPAEMPNVVNDHDQTRSLTLGEGIQDPVAGRVFDRYYQALQDQDFDTLRDTYDPDVCLISIVDDKGESVVIEGRDNVIANQRARWAYWTEQYGPVKHNFLATYITTHTAQLRVSLTNADIIFGSMYTMSDYKITSIRHMKDTGNASNSLGSPELIKWAQTLQNAFKV